MRYLPLLALLTTHTISAQTLTGTVTDQKVYGPGSNKV
jgi:hypothetical protein